MEPRSCSKRDENFTAKESIAHLLIQASSESARPGHGGLDLDAGRWKRRTSRSAVGDPSAAAAAVFGSKLDVDANLVWGEHLRRSRMPHACSRWRSRALLKAPSLDQAPFGRL